MEREIINFESWMHIAPLIDEYIAESSQFEEYYTKDGDYLGGLKGVDEFELVDVEINYIDLEKSYIENKVIIQRVSDRKYFEGTYYKTYHWNEYKKFPTEYKEVFIKGVESKLIFG